MIIEATECDFEALSNGCAPRTLRLVPDSAIAAPDVLEMLRKLAGKIRPHFAPAAWLIVGDGEVVGLCSLTGVPQEGDLQIGYGVAPTRHGRGYATLAIGELLDWARTDPRVIRVSAETGVDNIASQLVLSHNGFVRVGERVDEEDGPLICWQAETA